MFFFSQQHMYVPLPCGLYAALAVLWRVLAALWAVARPPPREDTIAVIREKDAKARTEAGKIGVFFGSMALVVNLTSSVVALFMNHRRRIACMQTRNHSAYRLS